MIKPYYQDDYCTIYHGDCRDILPEIERVDLVLTDPPYGIGTKTGTIGKANKNKIAYAPNFDDSHAYIKAIVIPAFNQSLLKSSGRAIITTGAKCMHLYPPCDSLGMFYQPATCSMQKWGRADCQPILYYGRDPRVGKTIDFCSYKLTEMPSCKDHPCSKPIKAWRWLVNKGSLDGELILDPFMGSGTTLLAAKELGRKAIGIELSEKYCEIAVKRLSQEVFKF